MAEILLTWFSIYGLPLLVTALIFGQMGVPVPTSILLLTVGAMLKESVYSAPIVFIAGLVGATIGDQASYWIGRKGGPAIIERLRTTRYDHVIERAEQFSAHRGAISVFFSRWLVPPVGPYLNYVVGATRLEWSKFTIMAVIGEAVWITIFVSIGFVFRHSIAETNDAIANTIWFLGALIATIIIGKHVRRALQKMKTRRSQKIT
ncbi:MAG: DedA family protein [Pseudomonadota bacterium]